MIIKIKAGNVVIFVFLRILLKNHHKKSLKRSILPSPCSHLLVPFFLSPFLPSPCSILLVPFSILLVPFSHLQVFKTEPSTVYQERILSGTRYLLYCSLYCISSKIYFAGLLHFGNPKRTVGLPFCHSYGHRSSRLI